MMIKTPNMMAHLNTIYRLLDNNSTLLIQSFPQTRSQYIEELLLTSSSFG